MAEKLKPPEPVYVRLKAPPEIGAVQTLSGRRITIGKDRIVEMSAEDANCRPAPAGGGGAGASGGVIRQGWRFLRRKVV
jgi:hypothetical protein